MKRIFNVLAIALISSTVFYSCSEEGVATQDEISPEILGMMADAGFNLDIQAPMAFEDGYLVERDIYVTEEGLARMSAGTRIPNLEQYMTTNLVSAGGGRVITMYAPEESSARNHKGKPSGGGGTYSPGMIAGLDLAIARYNARNLEISFQRITTDNADIRMTRLKKGDERQGILGSAGFPTAGGDPHNEIKMSGILESSYGLSTEGIATIIAHEMGHCVGFRHTDYFDRSVSCGSGGDEGQAGVGAILIPGTPSGATLADQSFMLSCTDGGDRPFNGDDQVALDYMY